MDHDTLCPHTEFIPCCESYLEHEYPQPAKQHYVACQCDLIAQIRADQDRKHWDKTKHLRDRIERLIVKANRWRDENADLRKQLKAASAT